MNNATTPLLVVDDDDDLRNLLSSFLSKHGYDISVAKNSQELFKKLEKNPSYKLIILDVMLPGMDGIEICRHIRKTSQIPIIMLTAVSEETDRIVSLELGADDYLVKPFNPRELLARIKAILRRVYEGNNSLQLQPTSNSKHVVLEFAQWKLNISTRRLVAPDNLEVPLSSGSYNLLVAFLEQPQRVLNRDQLLKVAKNRLYEPFDRSVDIQISRLRQKLEEDPKNPKLIQTVRTGGYIFACAVKRCDG